MRAAGRQVREAVFLWTKLVMPRPKLAIDNTYYVGYF